MIPKANKKLQKKVTCAKILVLSSEPCLKFDQDKNKNQLHVQHHNDTQISNVPILKPTNTNLWSSSKIYYNSLKFAFPKVPQKSKQPMLRARLPRENITLSPIKETL